MSLEHKHVVRNNDVYLCTDCGKFWDSTDQDPPACEPGNATATLRNRQATEAEIVARAAGLGFLLAKRTKRYSASETMLVAQMNSKGCLRQADFGRLEAAAVSAVDGWPTPSATVCAWLVIDPNTQRALLIYAADKHSARDYAARITDLAEVEVRRVGAMDKYARGMSAYSELNPDTLRAASKTSRMRVMSVLEWRK